MEEQGQNAADLALYGQDSNGTVWSICIMNMILHNITRSMIENGDTLEDPLILDNGQIRKFDRVLAKPAVLAELQPHRHEVHQSLPRVVPGVRQEGGPHVRAAHAGQPQAQRPNGDNHAARGPVPWW